MNHPIYSFLPGGFLGEEKSPAQQIAEECANVSSADFDTKAGREQTFKSTAKCAAETACAIYGKGAIPPGVCSSITGPIAGEAIKIWNSVFGDNEEAEKAKIRDANTAKFVEAKSRLRALDAGWIAHYWNTMTRLIQFHDKLLPSQVGAWGGGSLTKDTIKSFDMTKPGNPTKFQGWDVERYSNVCPLLKKLDKLGAPTISHKMSKCEGGMHPASLERVYMIWSGLNPKSNAVQATAMMNDILKNDLPKWTASLDKAANELRNEAVIEAVRKDIDDRRPKPSKVPIVVGGLAVGAGVAYWAWSKGLLKGIL